MSGAANPMIALNDLFLYNNKIARTLQQFLPPTDRKIIQLWFDKLLHMNKTAEQMVIRSDYMWYILLMLQSKRIREPFTKLPPHDIAPLMKFVPLQIYEEVLICNEPNMIYVQKNSADDILKLKEKRTKSTTCSSLDTCD